MEQVVTTVNDRVWCAHGHESLPLPWHKYDFERSQYQYQYQYQTGQLERNYDWLGAHTTPDDPWSSAPSARSPL